MVKTHKFVQNESDFEQKKYAKKTWNAVDMNPIFGQIYVKKS